MPNIYILRAEHYEVPGVIIRAFVNIADARAEAHTIIRKIRRELNAPLKAQIDDADLTAALPRRARDGGAYVEIDCVDLVGG